MAEAGSGSQKHCCSLILTCLISVGHAVSNSRLLSTTVLHGDDDLSFGVGFLEIPHGFIRSA
jgi:hypothetical protein